MCVCSPRSHRSSNTAASRPHQAPALSWKSFLGRSGGHTFLSQSATVMSCWLLAIDAFLMDCLWRSQWLWPGTLPRSIPLSWTRTDLLGLRPVAVAVFQKRRLFSDDTADSIPVGAVAAQARSPLRRNQCEPHPPFGPSPPLSVEMQYGNLPVFAGQSRTIEVPARSLLRHGTQGPA